MMKKNNTTIPFPMCSKSLGVLARNSFTFCFDIKILRYFYMHYQFQQRLVVLSLRVCMALNSKPLVL